MNARSMIPIAAMFLASCAGNSAALREERERVLAQEKRIAEEIAGIEEEKGKVASERMQLSEEAGKAEAEVRRLQAEVEDLRRVAQVYRAAQEDLQALQDEEDALLEGLDELVRLRSDPEAFPARSEKLRAEASWNLLCALVRAAPLREFIETSGVRPTQELEMALRTLEELREHPALAHPQPSRAELKEFAEAAATANLWLYSAGKEIVFDDVVSKALDGLSDAVEMHGLLARFLAGDLGSKESEETEEEEQAPQEQREPTLENVWIREAPLAPRLAPLWWRMPPATRSRGGAETTMAELERMLAALRLLAEIEEVRRSDWDPEAHLKRRLTNIRLVRERIQASVEALAAD